MAKRQLHCKPQGSNNAKQAEAREVGSTYLHRDSCFLAQLDQLLIALLNFLIQALVLNLQLLKVNEVQALCIETPNPLVAVMPCVASQTQGMLASIAVPAAGQSKWSWKLTVHTVVCKASLAGQSLQLHAALMRRPLAL